MNALHVGTFVWLRWRLFVNQLQRGGIANRVILAVLSAAACLSALGMFVGAVLAGAFLLPMASPVIQLLIWDGLAVVFLFTWFIGLLNELQRSEALTLEKFLHLPVSLAGVFILNYLSSFMSLTLLFFLPVLFGLTLGSVYGNGPAMLVQLPLAAAFIFVATALTYQFQGWLASLMMDKRRRRTIIVIITIVFVLVCQVPNLINVMQPWKLIDDDMSKKEKEALKQEYDAKRISNEEYTKKTIELHRKHAQDRVDSGQRLWENVQQTAWFANVVLPPGWLALGGATAAEGNIIPALLATIAYSLIGAASLWRAYRTVLRMYTGEFTATRPAPKGTAPPVPAAQTGEPKSTFLEKTITWIPEQATAIALATFRGLLRAPEAKMILISPFIMVIVFAGVFARGDWGEMPATAAPFIAAGAIAFILFTMMQLMGNQFGYDRAGFRIYILSPAPRREILMGKNLAMLPLVFVLVLPMFVVIEIFLRLRIDHLLALPAQFMSMFLTYALLANTISILAPMPVASGSLKPAKPKGLVLLAHLGFMMLLPIFLSPTLAPQAVEAFLTAVGLLEDWPIALPLVYLECAGIIALYRVAVTWQGQLLEYRELAILETVTSKAE